MILQELKDIINSCNINRIKKFGHVVGPFLIILGLILLWKHAVLAPYIILFGSLILLLTYIKPLLLKPVYIAWMCISTLMGFIMTRLILSILFMLVFTPAGLILRLMRKDLLKQKIDKNKVSYWITRKNDAFDAKTLENQF